MSHSPLHQRLHVRLAMRHSFSSPTLPRPPPYPNSLPPKKLPATALPSPEPTNWEPPIVPVEETASMRATHIRPRTTPASPERPGTAFSARSSIRQVEPSPESLSDALTSGLADSGTPPGPSFEPFPPFNPSESADTAADDGPNNHIPSTEPAASTEADRGALRRGGTPSGRTSPRKSRSSSPRKSRSQSPRKHMVHTPTLPAHQESPSSAYSAADSETLEAPDTPSPVSREQKSQAYAPLQVRRPFAGSNGKAEPEVGQGTHARIADYMRKMQTQQRSGKARATEAQRETTQERLTEEKVGAPVLHIVQAMAQPPGASHTLSPYSVAQSQAQKDREAARHTSSSRRSEASGASGASKQSVFSTPGRDVMERKKPIVEEDEGPFAEATDMRDLEQKRRTVSEGTRNGGEKDRRNLCGLKCMVM